MPPPVMPSENLDWNPSQSNVIDPPSGLKNTGYLPTEVPASQHHNWIFNLVDQWIQWLTYQVTSVVPTTGKATRGSQAIAFGASPYAITSADTGKVLEVDTSGGIVQLNLPDPLLNPGLIFTVKDSTGNFSTNKVLMHRFGTEEFEGLTSDYPMEAAWGKWDVFCDGANYFLI